MEHTRQVVVTKRALKQLAKLPDEIREIAAVLFKEIEVNGPVRGNWKNYGKLSAQRHHCHLSFKKWQTNLCRLLGRSEK